MFEWVMQNQVLSPPELLLMDVFAGHQATRLNEVLLDGRKLVHYTSASNALQIFRKRQIWMRNVRVMNDLREVTHGVTMVMSTLEALNQFSKTPIETGLAAVVRALNEIFPGLADEGNQGFLSMRSNIEYQSYVTCLSEHLPEEENIGRLSMWRNYTGNQIGVGIVINPTPFKNALTEYGASSSPVEYLDLEALNELLLNIARKINKWDRALLACDRQDVLNSYFHLLRSLCLATKHPGFREEREWRIFHTRGIDSMIGLSMSVEDVSGVPQRVIKLDLKNDVAAGIEGLEPRDLIDHIIIGPCQTPWVIGDAITSELADLGVANPELRIRYSNIPLRT